METHNKFFVSLHGDGIVILRPPTAKVQRRGLLAGSLERTHVAMSREDALLLAAWLVTCADPSGNKFIKLLASIEGDV